jgi:D-beta-D-heptose 7-phosphate kinase/D-beta-D-heptose 1-phosphate adenosyltransferase
MRAAQTKIKVRSDMPAIRDPLRQSGQRLVFTNGCFDILHAGHVSYLQLPASRAMHWLWD